MPRYDVRCGQCGKVEERTLPCDVRCVVCSCGGVAERLFPVTAALGFMPFQEHYDEALGCDIHSYGEKRRILRDKGLIEAGDRIKGALNFDKHAPEHIGKKPVQGVPYTSFRPRPQYKIGIEDKGQTHWLKESEVKTL